MMKMLMKCFFLEAIKASAKCNNDAKKKMQKSRKSCSHIEKRLQPDSSIVAKLLITMFRGKKFTALIESRL